MKRKQNRFVILGFILMIVAGILIISFYAITMRKKSNEAIERIGTVYMENMNHAITGHFQTIINLKINRLNGIVENNESDLFKSEEELLENLAKDGKIGNFEYLAFLSDIGEIQMIYGDQIEIQQKDLFVNSLNNNENKVALSINTSGEKAIALAISATYPMQGNKNCTALIAGISIDELSKIISGKDNDSIMFTNIIDKNGDYIIKNDDEKSNNYFNRIENLYSDYEEKSPDDYISEIKEAIRNNESYSSIFYLKNERNHLFCNPLNNSEWYMVTVMPYGKLDKTIENLDAERTRMILISLVIIVVIYTFFFILYYRKTKKQIIEINIAHNKAVQASKAKSDFLSNMSHDIRTPMNAIVGMTALASANIDNKPQLQNCLKKITQSNKQLLGLINDILDMSKIENGKMIIKRECVSLSELVSDIVTIIQPHIKEKRLNFNVCVGNIETENVYSDGVRLHQVVMNILSNAAKFTPDTGTINLSVYQEPSESGDNYVCVHFKISDNGIGMSEEFKNKIFDSFAREDNKRVNKTEGTGLGMAITKYIVDAMHGKIEVDSQQGVGTEFRVAIDMEKIPVNESDNEMRLPGWKILIVDDDHDICESTAASLDELGIESDFANSGKAAVEKVVEHHNAGKDYDYILMDCCMPDMDGIEATRMIYEAIKPQIPVIIISAYDWSEVENDAIKAGVAGFIQKPLFKSTLYNFLKTFTEKSDKTEILNSKRQNNYSRIRILVAEDNDINWEIINELLSQLGFIMEHAENGKECLEMFRNSEPDYYSAILMDIRMPIMDGYEATVEIRSLERKDAKNVPIIALTADAFSDDMKKCLEYGMNAHIAKPIELTEVLHQLEKYLNI